MSASPPQMVYPIMSARNRRCLVGQAISYFLRPNIPEKEPIIAEPCRGIEHHPNDTLLRERLTAAACDYFHENIWPGFAERQRALWPTTESH